MQKRHCALVVNCFHGQAYFAIDVLSNFKQGKQLLPLQFNSVSTCQLSLISRKINAVPVEGFALYIILLQRIGILELDLLLEEFYLRQVFLGEHRFQSFHVAKVALQKELIVREDVFFFANQVLVDCEWNRTLYKVLVARLEHF